MSKRHQASRRRSYGPRRHDVVERHGRELDAVPTRPDHDAPVDAGGADLVDLVHLADLVSLQGAGQLASLGSWTVLPMGAGD
jgi:hypothetical protein